MADENHLHFSFIILDIKCRIVGSLNQFLDFKSLARHQFCARGSMFGHHISRRGLTETTFYRSALQDGLNYSMELIMF